MIKDIAESTNIPIPPPFTTNSSSIPPVPDISMMPLMSQYPNSTSQKICQSKYIGLKNQGSTCYLNSLIQSWFMTPEFRYHLLKWEYNPVLHGEDKYCIPLQWQILFSRWQTPIRSCENTIALTKSFCWESNEVFIQQDIEELCRVLFEAISVSWGENETDFISKLYSGSSSSIIKCWECDNISSNSDKYLDWSLPILNIFDNIHNKSLEMALLNFIKPERLDKDNQYHCGKCNKKVDADKYWKFESFPNILFIQLGRFFYDYATDQRKKLNDSVPFPWWLNANKFKRDYKDIEYHNDISESPEYCLQYSEDQIKEYLTEGPDVYEWYSIVVHSGNANGGHYYAYIKSFEDNKWYDFNDSNVYELNPCDIIKTFGLDTTVSGNYYSSTTGYCLMYRRIGGDNKVYRIEDMVINASLIEFLKNENTAIIKEELEQKEKFNKMKIKINMDNTKSSAVKSVVAKIVDVNKTQTFLDFRKKICENLNIPIADINNFKVREYNSFTNKPTIYLEATDSTVLQATNISQYKQYYIQFKTASNGTNYPLFDPNLITISLYNYTTSIDQTAENTEMESYPHIDIEISNNKTIWDWYEQITTILHIKPGENIYLLNKTYFGNETRMNEISLDTLNQEQQIFLVPILDRTMLFIEHSDSDTYTITKENSKWMELFKANNAKITLKFKMRDKDGKDGEQHEIIISKYDTWTQLKKRMCEILCVDKNETIVKIHNRNGKEWMSLDESLEYYVRDNKEFTLYLEYGKPVQWNEVWIKLNFWEVDYEKFSFYPYKIREVGDVIINNTKTVFDLKRICLKEMAKKQVIQGSDINNSNDFDYSHILIRTFANGKPIKIYNDDDVLSEINFFNGIKVLLQFYPKDIPVINEANDTDRDNIVQLTLRCININTYTITPPHEVWIHINTSVPRWIKEILKEYQEIKHEGDIEVFKIANGANMFMDNIWSANFSNLVEYVDCTVGHYPWFIKNDGYMLLVKDKNIKAGEVSDEIKKYCFAPVSGGGSSIPDVPKGNRVKNMISLFENGDYDVVTHSKRGAENDEVTREKKKERIKEKGIVIKVKKNEGNDFEGGKEEKEGKEVKEENTNKKEDDATAQDNKGYNKIKYEEMYDLGDDGIEPLI